MKNIEKIIAIGMLIFAIGFNLWLYRLEPTATTDPNDNTFQFALVDRTNHIWDYASKECTKNLSFVICHLSFLVDHWVPNWAEGYNLPYYYSHIPQILIVASWRLFDSIIRLFHYSFIPLFTYYHLIIYLLLCLFPISMFLSLRIIKLPWLIAGIGALLSTHISTDGLYGLDPSSFLWRGYGLSSQLFSIIFLPIALSLSWRVFTIPPYTFLFHPARYPRIFWLAIAMLVATTAGHLGIGIMAIFSLIPLSLSEPLLNFLQGERSKKILIRLFLDHFKWLVPLAFITVALLSYWIVPILMHDNYHNISFWDPIWKFNSYGAKEIITRLLNGDLFDFGRFPVLTLLIIIGFFRAVSGKIFEDHFPSLTMQVPVNTYPNKHSAQHKESVPASSGARKFFCEQQHEYSSFALLFIFWLFMYFGRTTWGGLIDLIPGMKEFHLSRFIVGLHVAGLFLAPIGLQWIISNIMYQASKIKHIRSYFLLTGLCVYLFIGFLFFPIYKQTIRYNELNDRLIVQANQNYEKVKNDSERLFSEIHTLQSIKSGRVFAGRGGSWGKGFRVAETPYYMHLSTYGIPTVLWLPETWSPNSDTEQYIREEKLEDYDLYNIRYVATPKDQSSIPFWKLIKQAPTWKLYEVPTSGYVTGGIVPAIVSSDKRSYINVVRLWIQSDHPKNGFYPQLTFDPTYPKPTGLPNFRMTNESTYKVPDGSMHNLFTEPPVYLPSEPEKNPAKIIEILEEKNNSDMKISVRARLHEDCITCVVTLKYTYHPNWKVTINGRSQNTIIVFPFFVATPLTVQGDYEVEFAYEPTQIKTILLFTAILLISISVFTFSKARKNLPA